MSAGDLSGNLSGDSDSDELSPEAERDQLVLYADNFHRFVLEAIPRLEEDFHQETLEDMLKLAVHYQQAFYRFGRHNNLLAIQYVQTASRLVYTIRQLLGKPQLD